MPTKYDLAIIGSGGGAFAAAIRATTLGKSVVMIERGTLGGTCVNTGCVPSKALIAAADAWHSAADAADRFPGIETTAGPVDMPALIAGKQALVESLRGEKYADVADSYGWAVRRGDAAFARSPRTTAAPRRSRPRTTWSRLALGRGPRRSTAWTRPGT